MCYDKAQSGCPSQDLFCDGFDRAPCTINIYFIGDVNEGVNWGGTYAPNDPFGGDLLPNFIWISDGAGDDALDPDDYAFQLTYRTLEHELGCHYLPNFTSHTEPPPDNICPDDLCISGGDLANCLELGPPVPPNMIDDIPMPLRTQSIQRFAPVCGVAP